MISARLVSGVFAPVLTPFDAGLKPDRKAYAGFCRWLLAQGAGLAIFGTNSEANSLSLAERTGDSALRICLYRIPRMSGAPISLGLIGRLIGRYPETVVGIEDSGATRAIRGPCSKPSRASACSAAANRF
ncbi:MAG TPA: hypothetical protein VIK47_03855 [Kiloniellales bacterium]